MFEEHEGATAGAQIERGADKAGGCPVLLKLRSGSLAGLGQEWGEVLFGASAEHASAASIGEGVLLFGGELFAAMLCPDKDIVGVLVTLFELAVELPEAL